MKTLSSEEGEGGKKQAATTVHTREADRPHQAVLERELVASGGAQRAREATIE